ncbi:MAG: hypothetical protein AAF633_03600 [Chloroflexota bacterium]
MVKRLINLLLLTALLAACGGPDTLEVTETVFENGAPVCETVITWP